MSGNKIIGLGPKAITNAVTNMVNPPTVSGGTGLAGTNTATYLIIKRISVLNKTANPITYSMYIGATGGSAAGTEFMRAGYAIPPFGRDDFPCCRRLDTADFLTAIASANTSLVFEGSAEIGVA